jgi:hypothetical protein
MGNTPVIYLYISDINRMMLVTNWYEWDLSGLIGLIGLHLTTCYTRNLAIMAAEDAKWCYSGLLDWHRKEKCTTDRKCMEMLHPERTTEAQYAILPFCCRSYQALAASVGGAQPCLHYTIYWPLLPESILWSWTEATNLGAQIAQVLKSQPTRSTVRRPKIAQLLGPSPHGSRRMRASKTRPGKVDKRWYHHDSITWIVSWPSWQVLKH